jgi:hypothetical protein
MTVKSTWAITLSSVAPNPPHLWLANGTTVSVAAGASFQYIDQTGSAPSATAAYSVSVDPVLGCSSDQSRSAPCMLAGGGVNGSAPTIGWVQFNSTVQVAGALRWNVPVQLNGVNAVATASPALTNASVAQPTLSFGCGATFVASSLTAGSTAVPVRLSFTSAPLAVAWAGGSAVWCQYPLTTTTAGCQLTVGGAASQVAVSSPASGGWLATSAPLVVWGAQTTVLAAQVYVLGGNLTLLSDANDWSQVSLWSNVFCAFSFYLSVSLVRARSL